MTPLPQRLRHAREQAGLSLEELAARTKIRIAHLEAIERGAFDRLPGGIFTRGYLRAYAREVGLDPEAVVRDYLAEHGGEAEPSWELRAATWPKRDPLLDEPDRLRQFWTAMTAGAVMLLVVGFLTGERPGSRPAATGAVATAGRTAAAALPAPKPSAPVRSVAPRGGAATPTPSGSPALAFDIEAVDVVWIAARADGRRVVYRLMRPGERVSFHARDEILLRVGNAGALRYSINGRDGRPLGDRGAVRTVRITRANLQRFVAQAGAGGTPASGVSPQPF